MQKYAHLFLKYLTKILEFVIAALLACGIIIMTIKLGFSMGELTDASTYPNYDDLLTACFNLIIGVELIRMLYLHTPLTVFEVLMFAIARQIIMDHSSAFSSLIGVCAIAVLFATRKYLFFGFDLADKNLFRGSSRVRVVNKLMGCQIPHETDAETLEEVLRARCAAEDIEPKEGACVYFEDTGLRVAKMRDGKISRIEVIHAIH